MGRPTGLPVGPGIDRVRHSKSGGYFYQIQNGIKVKLQPTSDGGTVSVGASGIPSAPSLIANNASYYGLNIPVSAGKRAILGVPIFTGAVRTDGVGRYVDVAFGFGQPLAPPGVLVDTQVTKIWVDGDLVEEKNVNEGWTTSGTLEYSIYRGDLDQLPDPTIQKWLGVTDTPAFRGMIYIMFKDFPLHLFSNGYTIPFVRAELVDIVTNVVQIQNFTTVDSVLLGDDAAIPNWELNHLLTPLTVSAAEEYISTIDLSSNTEIIRSRIQFQDGTVPDFTAINSDVNGAFQFDPATGFIVTHIGAGANQRPLACIDPFSGLVLDVFGVSGTAFIDDEDHAQSQRFRAFVSKSASFNDDLFAASGFTSETIGLFRVSASGQISLAWSDAVLGVMGAAVDGNVTAMITGDKIGGSAGTGAGYGSFIFARETAVYRVTVPEGLNGNGEPVDVVASKVPLHLPPTENSYGGKNSSNYVDITDVFDVTNGAGSPSASALADGVLSFGFNLNDAGDLSAAALNDRVVAYAKFNGPREFRSFRFNTRTLNTGDPDGVIDIDIVVSADGVSWQTLDSFQMTNKEYQVWLGSNAGSSISAQTASDYILWGERYYNGAPFSPLPDFEYVGIAVAADDYTAGAVVSGATLECRGRDGLTVLDGEIQFPALTQPHMIKLWDAPVGHTIRMMWLPPDEDLVILFENDADTTVQYISRYRIIDAVKNEPLPADPAGAGLTEKWTSKLAIPRSNWTLNRHSWEYSNLTGGLLGYAVTDFGFGNFNLINLETGHQKQFAFTDWRFFGNPANETGDIKIEHRQVWNGAGNYLIVQDEDDITPEFNWSKALPFQTSVTGYNLSDFLDWFSQRAGYAASDVSVSASITDQVTGAILLERVPFRSMMESIGTVFDFDVFESEGTIKFNKVTKGAGFTVTSALTADKLSAINGGEGLEVTDNDPSVIVSRAPNDTLPNAVEIKYIDPTNDYQVNTAFAKRTRFPVNTSNPADVSPATLAVPLIMQPEDALLRASRLLYQIYNAQNSLSLRLPTEFVTLEPADVISLPVNGIEYTGKIIETIINADHSLSIDAQGITAQEIDEVTAQSPLQLPQSVSGPSASDLFFLDIPPINGPDALTQEGTGLSIYTALVSKGQGAWQSGTLFAKLGTPGYLPAYENGVDSEASGQALTVLPKGTESTTDFDNTLRVLLFNDDETIASVTDAQIQIGANLAAYGAPGRWEIIQVKTITNVAGKVYDFTEIVRGLRGTEVFSAQHEPGDKFILLDRPPVRLDTFGALTNLNSDILVKAVGAKQEEQEISPVAHALNGVFERMFPPTNIAATIVGSDVVFSWDRRTRLDSLWVDEFEEVPTEDTFAGYELEILASIGDTVPVRSVLALSEESYTYTAANITSDFGFTPGTFSVRVFAISSEVGRGLPAEVEVDAA